MKYLCIFFAAFQLSCGFVESAIQITTFGHPNGVVADTNEWNCVVSGASPQLIGGTYIKGTSKSLPMVFDFYYHMNQQIHFGEHKENVLNSVNNVLLKYAIATSTVFKNVTIKGDNKTCYTVTGSFFDNTSSGYFSLHIMKDYVMFVKLRTELFDENTRNAVMSKPLELITPLYSPRALFEIMGVDFENYTDCIILED